MESSLETFAAFAAFAAFAVLQRTLASSIHMGNSLSPEQLLANANAALLDFGVAHFKATSIYEKEKQDISYRTFNVQLEGDNGEPKHIYTIHHYHNKTNNDEIPLVMIHGYSQSAAQFYAGLPAIANEYKGRVYAIDLFGCGLSSRPPWTLGYGNDVQLEVAESYFTDRLEDWRKAMGFSKMKIAGHSIGGYLAVAYCEKYPSSVEDLILLSPVGLPAREMRIDEATLPWYFKLGRTLWQRGWSPFDLASISGKYLPDYYSHARYRDASWISKPLLAEQLYRNWTGGNSSGGGVAHCTLLEPGAYARRPLLTRLPAVLESIPRISFIYGENDWMTIDHAVEFALWAEKNQKGKAVKIFQVVGAGHALLVDNPYGMLDAITKSLDRSYSVHTIGGSLIEVVGAVPLMLEEGLQDTIAVGLAVECLWGQPRKKEFRAAVVVSFNREKGTCKLKWENGKFASMVPVWRVRLPVPPEEK